MSRSRVLVRSARGAYSAEGYIVVGYGRSGFPRYPEGRPYVSFSAAKTPFKPTRWLSRLSPTHRSPQNLTRFSKLNLEVDALSLSSPALQTAIVSKSTLARLHHAVVAVTVHEAPPDVADGVKCREHRDRTAKVHEQNGKVSPGALVYSVMKSNSETMSIIFVFRLFAGISLAAGPGFEPGLTDPESGSVRSRLFLVVSQTPYLSRFSLVKCFPMFSGVSGGLVYQLV